MKVRTKLTLRFSLIVASILAGFSLTVYYLSSNYRREEFFTRLESRAITTARLLVTVEEVDKTLLRIIDKNSIHALFEEKVLIFNEKNNLEYSSLDDFEVRHTPSLLERIRWEKKIFYTENDYEHVGLLYDHNGEKYVVIASAYDRYGRSKLENLRNVLLLGMLFGLVIIGVSGVIFAGQAIHPVDRLNHEISTINAGNLSSRVDVGNGHDEIAQLAINFNKMLARLEASFEAQQQFVSSASHELRTPLASMTGQFQLILDKDRSPEEYRQVLRSLYEDARSLITITNGLLTLAQSESERQRIHFQQIRVDEVLFAAQDELGKNNPDYHFLMEYGEVPEDESALILVANEHLLKIAFVNLMDNACKFSDDHSVQVNLNCSNGEIEISFTDRGSGIPKSELERIFLPFYRCPDDKARVRGYGIGLALCQRIVGLHGGQIGVESEQGVGSCFWIRFRRLPF